MHCAARTILRRWRAVAVLCVERNGEFHNLAAVVHAESNATE